MILIHSNKQVSYFHSNLLSHVLEAFIVVVRVVVVVVVTLVNVDVFNDVVVGVVTQLPSSS